MKKKKRQKKYRQIFKCVIDCNEQGSQKQKNEEKKKERSKKQKSEINNFCIFTY